MSNKNLDENENPVGIDLGTTNSEIAIFRQGSPHLVEIDGKCLMPSVVGVDEKGEILVGQPALNQCILYPERTVRSIKRKMGSEEPVVLTDRELSPVEVSAIILKRLKQAAEKELGRPVRRAVITVPAHFTDAQRMATKEAGEVAGFVVERILNEPTAASLLYASDEIEEQVFLVYDLGGGTFDVSVVKKIGVRLEVLASAGDNQLGGDDFDRAVVNWASDQFLAENGMDPLSDLRARSRLTVGSERTKIKLSTESYVRFIEENLIVENGKPMHLDSEISRRQFEELIYPLIEGTKHAVNAALRDAGVLAHDLDEVLLVGGSTRIPLVSEVLKESTGKEPRRDIDPDTAVAKGAALQAARICGKGQSTILVDVSPFSFGISYLDFLHGEPAPFCYKPIIRKNTPLPSRQTEIFYTVADGQQEVEVNVYQGEDPDARNNLKIGRFYVKDLDEDALAHSPVLFDLTLNLNGILNVEVTEKHTGLKKKVTIEDSFRRHSIEDIEEMRAALFGLEDGPPNDETAKQMSGSGDEGPEKLALGTQAEAIETHKKRVVTPARPKDLSAIHSRLWMQAQALLEKTHTMRGVLEDADRVEVEELARELYGAMETGDFDRVGELSDELADVLFYLE